MGGAAHTPSKLLLSDLPPSSGQTRGLSTGIHPSPDQSAAPSQSLWSQICLMDLVNRSINTFAHVVLLQAKSTKAFCVV